MKTKYITTTYEDEVSIVRIHKPILTAKERKRREQIVKDALVRYTRAQLKGV
jgi:hypothetical protein